MNDMTLFLDLILLASGVYCMYTWLRLAVTKHLFKNGLLVPKEKKISDCADEAEYIRYMTPPLAVMAARRDGTTHFVNAARLRMKESDRLSTTAALLHALGVSAEETADSLTVRGVPSFSGGTVDGANDHRIVMAAAAAATAAAAPVTVTGAEAVRKSYPSFWEEYKRLGGSFDVL